MVARPDAVGSETTPSGPENQPQARSWLLRPEPRVRRCPHSLSLMLKGNTIRPMM